MGKRTTSRRLAMQTLFQLEMGQDDLDFALQSASESETFIDDTLEFTRCLVEGVRKDMVAIDKIIEEKSIGWSLDRITAVDKAILRMAIYEIKFQDPPTPSSVVINEAVNLAKKFSTEDSSKFVNGILGGLVK